MMQLTTGQLKLTWIGILAWLWTANLALIPPLHPHTSSTQISSSVLPKTIIVNMLLLYPSRY